MWAPPCQDSNGRIDKIKLGFWQWKMCPATNPNLSKQVKKKLVKKNFKNLTLPHFVVFAIPVNYASNLFMGHHIILLCS